MTMNCCDCPLCCQLQGTGQHYEHVCQGSSNTSIRRQEATVPTAHCWVPCSPRANTPMAIASLRETVLKLSG